MIGLTGGIATGKSTVAALLRGYGVPVIDADQGARAVVAPGEAALDEIVQAFGSEVLDDEGALDRTAMRARISADPLARATLEGIVHPAIREWMALRLQEQQQAGAAFAVVEAALLVETGSYRAYPILIVVSCDPTVQRERLMARDEMTDDAARALIATQMSMAEKEAVATHVVRNDADLEALRAAVHRVWTSIQSEADQ